MTRPRSTVTRPRSIVTPSIVTQLIVIDTESCIPSCRDAHPADTLTGADTSQDAGTTACDVPLGGEQCWDNRTQ